MIYKVTFKPGSLSEETVVRDDNERYKEYSIAYVGMGTYCWSMNVDNGIEGEADQKGRISSNLLIGAFNSIAYNLRIILGRNHNMKRVELGALGLMLDQIGMGAKDENSHFRQKSTVIIQNDCWIGENVTIMAGVTVHNGAVIAQNSHVVCDVPPYAVVGGNPARIIGYRFEPEIIERLQKIQWWSWGLNRIMENANYFNEDVAGFCDRFFPEAEEKCKEMQVMKEEKDTYFMFVDYYENYCSYPYILESFLDTYIVNAQKKLVLFIQDDTKEPMISDNIFENIQKTVNDISAMENIKCEVILERGSKEKAKEIFYKCRHYIVSRTYYAVEFSCLADMCGIEVIPGCDDNIPFVKKNNIYKS